MEVFFNIMIFVLGLCVGSFINMLVYRTARRYEISNYQLLITNDKRSYCDYCGRQLNWFENIPVVSWLIQKGKTRCCQNPLPWEYLAVETMTGMLFLFFLLVKTPNLTSLQIISSLVILTLMIFSALFDLKYMILPDFSTYILIGLTIINVDNWLSALGMSGFLLFLYLITKGKGMGFGDVKLAIFMGLLLGFPKIVVAFYVAFIVGAIAGLGLILAKKKNKRSEIPFGPFLLLGTVVAWWWGEVIIKLLITNY